MYYSPALYTSPLRPLYVSRQAHSYHAQDPPPSTQSPPMNSFSRGTEYFAESSRQSYSASHRLFPLISKFEALGALSHETQASSTHPTVLQISRISSPRSGGTDGPASTQCDSIFSPRTRCQGRYESVLVENILASGSQDIFTSATVKRSSSGRLKHTLLPLKVSNLQSYNGTPKIPVATVRVIDGLTRVRDSAEKPMVKDERENNVVRERIKFYDRYIEYASLSGPDSNLNDSKHARDFPASSIASRMPVTPSLYAIAPACLHIHKRYSQYRAHPPWGPSTTGGYKARTIAKKSGTPDPQTPRKPSFKCGAQRLSPCGQTFHNPFSQTPYTNPLTRLVSPFNTSTRSRPEKYGSIGRVFENPKPLDLIEIAARPAGKQGRSRMHNYVAKRWPMVHSERKTTSEKVKGLRHAKTLERSCATITDQGGSQDQDIRMLRKRALATKTPELGLRSLSREIYTPISTSQGRDFSTANSLTPPRAHNFRAATICIGSASKPVSKSGGTRIPSTVRRESTRPSTPSKGSCRGIHDKIKRWESKADIKGQVSQQQKEWSPLKTLINPLTFRKSKIENPCSEEVGTELESRGMNEQDIQSIVNECQDIAIGKEIKNDPGKRGWKMNVAPRLRRGSLVAGKDCGRETDDEGEMDKWIIVRGVQCGLKEPKPLRSLEMKRMILLCRERVSVGVPVYIERGDVHGK